MKDDLTKREFIKGGDIILLFSMQGKFCEVPLEKPCLKYKMDRIRTIHTELFLMQTCASLCLLCLTAISASHKLMPDCANLRKVLKDL